jgi:2'-5' RNA ligase
LAFGLGYQIQTIVQTVVQIDVSMARRPEDYFGAGGETDSGMARQVFTAQVRLSLDDDAGGLAMHKQLPQQRTRDFSGWALIKASWENDIHSPIMRLFTAIDLEASVSRKLQVLIAELQPVARLRWSRPENLHITTKFIGEWPEERLPELSSVMPAGVPPFISVSGVGFFPNERYPKVFFARVESSAELSVLARSTDLALQGLGIPAEKHPYRPHVTLARVPESVRLERMRERLQELKPGNFGTFRALEYSLFESCAGRYTKRETFPLQEQA